MLQIDIKTVAHNIVQHALRGQGRKDQALYLNFDLRLSNYAKDGNYDQSRGLHLVYHSLPDSSWITVFSGITKSPFASIKEVKEWYHECSHDSCWRDISTFADVYFDMASCINEERKRDGLPYMPPIEMHESHNFRRGLFEWVWAEVIIDPTDEHRYRKLLTLKEGEWRTPTEKW